MDFKGFMQKVNNQLTLSSSGKFKGQGRVLGSSSSSSSGPTSGTPFVNPHRNPNRNPSPPSVSLSSSSNSKALSQKISDPPPKVNTTSLPLSNSKALHDKSSISSVPPYRVNTTSSFEDQNAPKPTPNRSNLDGFDPFDSLITTGKRNKNGYLLNVFECPVCNCGFVSEDEVSLHIESCIDNPTPRNDIHEDSSANLGSVDCTENEDEASNSLETCVGTYLSGNPADGSIEIMLRLLRNVVKEPENAKFRKIRMSNPKIREAIGEIAGGIELLESVGFVLKEEGEEMWALLDSPSNKHIQMLEKAIRLFEQGKNVESLPSRGSDKVETEKVEPEKIERKEPGVIDRQIKVFFAVSERVASRIELPESFYNLSLEEAKREAEMRRKKMAESQLLIPKSYKEKQAQAARRRYTRAIIRVQFPDGVVLQGVFYPREPTTALYEFVSSALKQQGLEFELIHPVPVKRRVIPCVPPPGERQSVLADEDLVPSALIKFKPIEIDDVVFIGLTNELLLMSEPLGSSGS